MLKAYDYAESSYNKVEIQDAKLFQKEKQIAQKYVLEHPMKIRNCTCPICDCSDTKYIFERWDVNYQFCNECKSIFVSADDQTIAEYLKLEEMKELRNSEEYQIQARDRRTDIWEELILWAEFRAYRYLGRNVGLEIIDYGNKYAGFVELFRQSKMAGRYELRDSILPIETQKVKRANVILYMNQLQHEQNPIASLKEIRDNLQEDGILVLSTRLGNGFDILTLKGGIDDVFPYEHVMLPSKKGMEIILERSGFELLEVTTPGTRDMDVVLKNKERLEESNFFVKYLLDTADRAALADFQQFLQKSGLSSFAQVIARKKCELHGSGI